MKRGEIVDAHVGDAIDFSRMLPVYAPSGMRLIAVAFDWMLLGLLGLLILLAVDATAAHGYRGVQSALLVDVLVLLVCLPFLYFVGFWYWFDATPGKMLLSLRIVDADTLGSLTGWQCLLRYLGYVLGLLTFGLGMTGVVYARRPQGWHDRLARSSVVVQQ
jgi:uncharacterized RDD family membrane protein YckC